MSDPEILNQIESVVAEVLGEDKVSLSAQTTADSVEGWDSLSHIQIVVGLENAFGIRFSAAELIDFQNVGALADGIKRKLAGQNP
jgi:acyl carrier protein